MFGIIKSGFGIAMGIGKYAIKGVRGTADVSLARIGMKRDAANQSLDLAKTLNSGGSRVKELLHLLVIVACMAMIFDIYWQLRADMSDDLIKFFLGVATGPILGYFGVKGVEAVRMPATMRAKGQASKDHAEARAVEKKLFDAEVADDFESMKALSNKRLSRELLWFDVLKSTTAADEGIDNYPAQNVRERIFANLEQLANETVDPIVSGLRRVGGNNSLEIVVGSGYRSPALNQVLGGSGTSPHKKGLAIDFEITRAEQGETLELCWQMIRDNHKFWGVDIDQCLLETRNIKGGAQKEWIHLAVRSKVRGRGRGRNRAEFFKLHNPGNKITEFSKG